MKWTIEKLMALKVDEIMDLFCTLDAPPFVELDGEYHAGLLEQHFITKWVSKWATEIELLGGKWQCKAFLPTSSEQGHGYNSFMYRDRTIRKYRMKTQISPSRFDGRDAFLLDYGYYKTLLGFINMADELRKIETGLYLGIGTLGFTRKQRLEPLPFYLKGPTNPFVGSDREEAYWLQWLDKD